MASGVKITDNVSTVVDEMKIPNKGDRLRLITLGFVEFEKEMQIDVVQKIYQSKLDAVNEDAFTYMKATLFEKKKCNYVLYDCYYNNQEASGKEEVVFFMWCPDDAPVQEKMKYASSKDCLKKVLTGVKHNIQLNDLSDIASKRDLAEKLGKNITSMEGEEFEFCGIKGQ